MQTRHIGLVVLALSAVAFSQEGASAQSANEATAQPAKEAKAQPASAVTDVEEVIVVARRRAENNQKVPEAVTAISGDKLTNMGISRAEDLQEAVPDLRIANSTSRQDASIFLRGQGPGPIFSGARTIQSATTYFDEVPTTVTGAGAYIDLQSVQVVKGPQGTLFGRNNTGGALLLVPTKPSDEFGGYITTQLGNYNDHEIEGAVDLPVIQDKLNIRLTTRMAHRDGYTKDVANGKDLDDENYQYYRASIDYTPTTNLENYTILSFQNVHEHGSSHVLTNINPSVELESNILAGTAAAGLLPPIPLFIGGPYPSLSTLSSCASSDIACEINAITAMASSGGAAAFPNPAIQNALAQQQALGPRKVFEQGPSLEKDNNYGATNITTYAVNDDLTIKNIFGYRLDQSVTNTDLLGGNLPILRIENEPGDGWGGNFQQFSEEFQLQGTSFGKRLEWIFGSYLEFVGEGPGGARVRSITLDQAPQIRDTAIDDMSKSIFGEATYDLSNWLAGLKLTAGLRQNWDRRKAVVKFCDPNAGSNCSVLDPAVALAQQVQSASVGFQHLSYNLTASDEVNDNLTAYIADKNGYRQGGFILPKPVVGSSSFAPEDLTEFEIGAKYAFDALAGPGHLNVALFRDHYVGHQVLGPTVAAVGGGVTTLTDNLGPTNFLGAEFEAAVTPFENFSLSVWYSYIHAPNGTARPDVGETAQDQVDQVPVSKYGISGAYTLSFIPDTLGAVTLRADWSWQSHFWWGGVPRTDPTDFSPNYGLLNARVSWDNIGGSSWSASVFATNALNKLYVAGAIPALYSLGFDSVLYGEPRMIGATATYRFGADE